MSAIAGVWYPDGRPGAKADCTRVSRALALYGPHRDGLWDGGEIALAHRLMRFLPEDRFDRQPLAGRGGRLRLVADCRIDNREELGRALGIGPADQAMMCDAAFILAALDRWGEGALERLCGDFAFAAWDSDARTLLLARDPVGNRPLHYHAGAGWFAFASMPRGLLALADVPTGPDPERLLTWQMLLPLEGRRSFYKGVSRLEIGHLAVIGADGRIVERRHWDPRRVPRRHVRGDEDAVALREALDRAVGAQVRGLGGTAMMLSGGLDSTALAGSAAPLLAARDRQLQAYTNVPAGQNATFHRQLLADEGPLAAMMAARHPNIDHHLVQAHDAELLPVMERMIALADQPVMNPLSTAWMHEIFVRAARAGAPVVLTGVSGNMGLTYTGEHLLIRHVARLRLWSLWRDAGLLASLGIHRTRGRAIRLSVRPLLPADLLALWRRLQRSPVDAHPAVLPVQWDSPQAQALFAERAGPAHPLNRVRTWQEWHDIIMRSRDPGPINAAVNAAYGIDRRDPTSDRRLLEVCLSLGEDRYLRNGRTKDVFRRAFADRIPSPILDNPQRGFQTADWKQILLKAKGPIQAELAHQARVGACTDLIDIGDLQALADSLDQADPASRQSVERHFLKLTRGLAAGLFTRRAAGGN
ncbi:asparagine synthetase B family protein [Zavarzinia sp. CC-PAN008]|uniref:asparagine synthetase B family protein n=1 Tax=Zavarzinia sp. CC-PAN008 TaxID=3243332 RepID=UPI003F7440CF